MDWKKLACMLAIASFTFVGCGDDDGTDDGDGDTTMADMGTPEPLDCGECKFVASTLSVPVEEDSSPGTVDGFNLDETVTNEGDATGCGVQDWTAPNGTTGVDNQLARLAPSIETLADLDLSATIEEALGDGSIVLLMQLEGVDSTIDSDVTLRLHLGAQGFITDGTFVGNAVNRLKGGAQFEPAKIRCPHLTLLIKHGGKQVYFRRG